MKLYIELDDGFKHTITVEGPDLELEDWQAMLRYTGTYNAQLP
jgi:hypothetical protein